MRGRGRRREEGRRAGGLRQVKRWLKDWINARLVRKMILAQWLSLSVLLILATVVVGAMYGRHIKELLRERFLGQTQILVKHLRQDLEGVLSGGAATRPMLRERPGQVKRSPALFSARRGGVQVRELERVRGELKSVMPLLRRRVQESALLLGAAVSIRLPNDLCVLEARPSPHLGGYHCHQARRAGYLCHGSGESVVVSSSQGKDNAKSGKLGVKSWVLPGVWVRESKEGGCYPKRRSRWRSRWYKRHLRKRGFLRSYVVLGGKINVVYHLLSPFPQRTGGVLFVVYLSLLFLGTGFLAIPLSRSIARPLRDLGQAVRQIQEGELEEPVVIKGDDEVGDLARTIESMRGTLLTLSKDRQALISDVSHEVRTPLARIRTVAESVADGLMREPERLTQVMEGICTQVDEVGHLIGDLLDVARFDLPNQRQLEWSKVDIAELLTDIVRTLEPAAQTHGIELVLSELPEQPLRIEADLRRLRQVFNNILQNALRYSPAGGSVKIGGFVGEESVTIEISDQGAGIPLDEREKIFERLYRIDPSRSRQTGGQGLGLAIVKKIVEAHGGTVGVDDAQGGGARFWVRLPFKRLV